LPALGVPGMLRVAAFFNQWLHGSLVWSIISLGHHLLTVDSLARLSTFGKFLMFVQLCTKLKALFFF
jgi:hypothetical protein